MEKIIKVGDYEFKAKSTAASFIVYKREFGSDAMGDILRFVNDLPNLDKANKEDFIKLIAEGKFDFETFLRFAWVFAKTADDSIPPFVEWLDSFEIPIFDFITEVLPSVQELLFSQMKTTVKPKKK